MSANSHGTPAIAKYILYIIIFAVIYEFLPGVNVKSFFPDMNITPYKVITGVDNVIKNSNKNIDTNSDSGTDRMTLNNIIESKNYKIKKVVDGDTVDIYDLDNSREVIRVRLIGINTPESVDPRRPVECYGKEASEYAKSILNGENLTVEVDSTQDLYDKNGRLLAYVYLADGQMVNRKIIADGYAYEYTYSRPYKYQKEFKTLQDFAKSQERGLWSPQTCNGIK